MQVKCGLLFKLQEQHLMDSSSKTVRQTNFSVYCLVIAFLNFGFVTRSVTARIAATSVVSVSSAVL